MELGIRLHEIGLFLQYHTARFQSLMLEAPEMSKFLFDEPLDVGQWRKAADDYEQAVNKDSEAEEDEFMKVDEVFDEAQKDVAAYQMMYLVVNLWVGPYRTSSE